MMKTKVYLFFIKYHLIIIVILYLLLKKSLATSMTYCEGEVTLASLKQSETYVEATPHNLALLAREQAEQKKRILLLLFDYTKEIKIAFNDKSIPLYTDEATQQISVQLYFTHRDFLDRVISEYSDSLFREVIDFLFYNHMEYNNVMLDHLIALYTGIITNSENVDGNGFLVNNRGMINDYVYRNTLNKLLEFKPH